MAIVINAGTPEEVAFALYSELRAGDAGPTPGEARAEYIARNLAVYRDCLKAAMGSAPETPSVT